jgi:hypothetical protein
MSNDRRQIVEALTEERAGLVCMAALLQRVLRWACAGLCSIAVWLIVRGMLYLL